MSVLPAQLCRYWCLILQLQQLNEWLLVCPEWYHYSDLYPASTLFIPDWSHNQIWHDHEWCRLTEDILGSHHPPKFLHVWGWNAQKQDGRVVENCQLCYLLVAALYLSQLFLTEWLAAVYLFWQQNIALSLKTSENQEFPLRAIQREIQFLWNRSFLIVIRRKEWYLGRRVWFYQHQKWVITTL